MDVKPLFQRCSVKVQRGIGTLYRRVVKSNALFPRFWRETLLGVIIIFGQREQECRQRVDIRFAERHILELGEHCAAVLDEPVESS